MHTVSAEPSCYMYQYVNTTQTQLDTKISHYEAELNDNPDGRWRSFGSETLHDINIF